MKLMLAAAAALLIAAPAFGASTTANSKGKVLFVAACGSCHTLAAAHTKGRKGPNLGQEGSSYFEVVDQVTHGGRGMPAFGKSLTKQQIGQIATFVAQATAGSGD